MIPMLELDAVSAFYGPMQSLHDVSLQVNAGEIVVLVGANGAGKSTLLRAISGVVRRQGAISFEGSRIDGRQPEDVVRLGIVHVPEGRRIFPSMTVLENLQVGGHAVGRSGASIRQGIEETLEYFPRLQARIGSYGWSLSGGEQQMLAVGRGLMAKPRLLMLDEPSLGLAPLITQDLFEIISGINKSGVSMLVVEQNVGLALKYGHRCYVIETGSIVKHGTTAEMADDPAIAKAYLGS
ncbi:ABC transporter ATP-binding protein [Mesorhizobium sp.]|jgi:branched-chain amino acid transport system ATP-binding protein|uniref:ABC transporter ATP-binding protein n=1 Tax=Mesorhizobium sp. TaxID=1871066 RepID=UPI003562C23A